MRRLQKRLQIVFSNGTRLLLWKGNRLHTKHRILLRLDQPRFNGPVKQAPDDALPAMNGRPGEAAFLRLVAWVIEVFLILIQQAKNVAFDVGSRDAFEWHVSYVCEEGLCESVIPINGLFGKPPKPVMPLELFKCFM
jgi:hypothetical protein